MFFIHLLISFKWILNGAISKWIGFAGYSYDLQANNFTIEDFTETDISTESTIIQGSLLTLFSNTNVMLFMLKVFFKLCKIFYMFIYLF